MMYEQRTHNAVSATNVTEIAGILDARIIETGDINQRVKKAFASDLMSDVLTLETDHTLLITGLNNVQAIRTAEMSDITCIVFARNKKVNQQMIEVARENQILLMETAYSVYRTSGELYQAGIKPIY